MKTTLVQLDENDDILSIKDKMQWNPSNRILLIVPHNNRCIHRRLDLTLLQRAARKNGAQIAVATSQRNLHHLAEIADVPVFLSVLSAQKQEWPGSDEKLFKIKIHQKSEKIKLKAELGKFRKERVIPNWQKVFFFLLGTLSPILLIMILIPRSTVTIIPVKTTQKLNLEFKASPTYDIVSFERNIPAHILNFTLLSSGVIATTGEASIPNQFANGSVRIMNLTDQIINLPAYTKFGAGVPSEFLYQSVEPIQVPAGRGQFVDVPIMALLAGGKGNTPPLTIDTIQGQNNSQLQVMNIASITGGRDIKVKAVSKEDVEKLSTKLLQELYLEANASIKNITSQNEISIPESLSIISEITSTNLSIGDAGSYLSMEMKSDFQLLSVQKDDFQKLVYLFADIYTPRGYQRVEDSLKHSPVEITAYHKENQVIHAKISITQSVQKMIDTNQLIVHLTGKSRKTAAEIIKSEVSLEQPPKIKISPTFWFWMPLLPGRIIIESSGAQ